MDKTNHFETFINLKNQRTTARKLLYKKRQWVSSAGQINRGKFFMSAVLVQEEFQTITDQKVKRDIDGRVFGKKVGFIAKLFGCWHEDVGRPFTEGKTAYRACLSCGARKQFDSKTLKTHGKFYFPPLVKKIDYL